MLWAAIVVVIAITAGVGGWLCRSRSGVTSTPQPATSTSPPVTSASLPAGIKKGDFMSLGGSIPPKTTSEGKLESAGMHVEQNQWIGAVRWTPKGGEPTKYDLHLGESIHIGGLGTVTLLAVTPPSTTPADRSNSGGGREGIHINVNLDPGLHWCEKWDPC